MGRQQQLLCEAALIFGIFIPLAAVRDNFNPEHLRLDLKGIEDDCAEEGAEAKRIFLELGYQGSLEGDHCNWPVLDCDSCMVFQLQCGECNGRLPERTGLRMLRKVQLTSPELTGDLSTFLRGLKSESRVIPLTELNLQGTKVTGDIRILAEMVTTGIVTVSVLHLQDTLVWGDLQVFRGMQHASKVDLSRTAVVGELNVFEESGEALNTLKLSGVAGLTGDVKCLKSTSRLQVLDLSDTPVTGDISILKELTHIQEADLSRSQVFGHLDDSWRKCCDYLELLDVSKTLVHFLPQDLEELHTLQKHWVSEAPLFRALTHLDISHCPVNRSVHDLWMVLAMSPHLASIKAAHCGLSGALPQLRRTEARLHLHGLIAQKAQHYTYPLAKSLQTLDLSGNHLTNFSELPVSSRLLLQDMENALVIGDGILAEALQSEVLLNLSQTELANRKEAQKLLALGVLRKTNDFVIRDDQQGCTCYGLAGTSILVTPAKFLPDELCQCLAGWHGVGATCQKCPGNFFSASIGQNECQPCPLNSTSEEGASAKAQCICSFGRLHNGHCGCDRQHALLLDSCVPCHKLHLQCNQSGSAATTAIPQRGYTRLEPFAQEAYKCHPPAEIRCPGFADEREQQFCGAGYTGTLCASCADGFWATGNLCRICSKASWTSLWALGLLAAAALLLAALLGYRKLYGQATPQPPSAQSLLLKLLLLESPVLLQTVQLWAVLSHLSQRKEGNGTDGTGTSVPYLEALQFTVSDLQDSLNLQCTFDGTTVRTLAALSSPLLPLLLLACCSALEIFRAGMGVNMALKTLTLLFIGGASSTADLLSCQSLDGDGHALGSHAFRRALPQLHCDAESRSDAVGAWADVVGYSAAVGYGLLIPSFLAGLMVRQYFALQSARLCLAHARVEPAKVIIHIQTARGQLHPKILPKRLVAAAAAHLSVHCRGKMQVQLQEETVTLIAESRGSTDDANELDALKLVADAETSQNLDALKCRRIFEMLTERTMLSEAKDRLLLGAQPLLCKYTLCQDVWMDVAMKLYAVTLVSFVSMSDAWKFTVALCLGMSVLVWVSHPYMHPQVSHLQSFCCFALALASMAFIQNCFRLAQLVLLGPLLLLLSQVRCPDCTEALAERCFQELEEQLPKLQAGEAHELHVRLLRF